MGPIRGGDRCDRIGRRKGAVKNEGGRGARGRSDGSAVRAGRAGRWSLFAARVGERKRWKRP
ncbi:hypothetical protein LG3211_0668 [Lysobacter gummosus]|nr:hypothetical protein LG3211_0668 [Lysobacter gummosus]